MRANSWAAVVVFGWVAAVTAACGSRSREDTSTLAAALSEDAGDEQDSAEEGDATDESDAGDEGDANDDAVEESEAPPDASADASQDALLVQDAPDDGVDAGDAEDAPDTADATPDVTDDCSDPPPPSCDDGQRACTELPGSGLADCVPELDCSGGECACEEAADSEDSTLEGDRKSVV